MRYYSLVAVALVALMIVPQYASAETISNTLTLNAPSEHEGQYDEVVNVANSTSATNKDTWNPAAEGIWFGSSTEESLYQYNTWTAQYTTGGSTYYSQMVTTSEFQFSNYQIMNGVSDFVIRLPFEVDSDVHQIGFWIYAIPSNSSYYLDVSGYILDVSFYDIPNSTYICGASWDPAIGTPTTSYQYVVDERAYAHLAAPLLADQLYLLVCKAWYHQNGQMAFYLAPNDVCDDGIYHSYIGRYVTPTSLSPTTYHYSEDEYSIDVGFSFDMREGIGGHQVTKSMTVESGDTMKFYAYSKGFNNATCYVNIFIPFWTGNGSVYLNGFTVKDGIAGSTLISKPNKLYKGMIVASTNGTVSSSASGTALGDYLYITLTFAQTTEISFLYDAYIKEDSLPGGYYSYNLTAGTDVRDASTTITRQICMGAYSTVMMTSNKVITDPNYDLNVIPKPDEVVLNRYDWLGGLSFALGLNILTGGLASLWIVSNPALIATLGLVASEVVYSGLTGQSLFPGTSVNYWLNGILPGLGSITIPDPAGTLGGIFKNLLDGIYDDLLAVGDFLWSIGEWIYNGLVWLANAIIEYGSIILGLLCILVIFIIFFTTIWGQIKLWSIGLKMAQGKFEAAAQEAGEVVDAAEGVARRLK